MGTVQPIRDKDIIIGIKEYLRLRSMRNYLMFCFGIYSGLRISDLLQLKVWMVRNTTHIKTKETKNKNKKRFIIHPSIRNDLNNFIKNMDDDEFIFASRQIKNKTKIKGLPITRQAAYQILNDAAEVFNLEEIGTHTLRKTWGYLLYEQNPSNITLLMEIYGHKDPANTLRYIGYSQDMMDEAILKL